MDVLFLVPDESNPNGSETAVRDALVAKGHTVTYRSFSTATNADATGRVVLITDRGNSTAIETLYFDQAVPIVLMEWALASDYNYGLGGGRTTNDITDLNAIDVSHSITSFLGSTGDFTFYSSAARTLRISGTIGSGAQILARIPTADANNGDQPALIVYESGALTKDDVPAPDRRVYFPMATVGTLSADGETLLSNAIDWAGGGGVGGDSASPSDLSATQTDIGSPSVSQQHAVAPSDLSLVATSIGTPSISQSHDTAPSDIVLGATTLSSPNVSQSHSVETNTLPAGQSILGTPSVGTVYRVSPDRLTFGITITESPNISQEHQVTGNNLVLPTSILGSPGASRAGLATPTILLGASPLLGSPSVASENLNNALWLPLSVVREVVMWGGGVARNIIINCPADREVLITNRRMSLFRQEANKPVRIPANTDLTGTTDLRVIVNKGSSFEKSLSVSINSQNPQEAIARFPSGFFADAGTYRFQLAFTDMEGEKIRGRIFDYKVEEGLSG